VPPPRVSDKRRVGQGQSDVGDLHDIIGNRDAIPIGCSLVIPHLHSLNGSKVNGRRVTAIAVGRTVRLGAPLPDQDLADLTVGSDALKK